MLNEKINSSNILLDIALCAAGFEPACEEQVKALSDPDQAAAMLDDMEARMGVDVSHVRRSLCLT